MSCNHSCFHIYPPHLSNIFFQCLLVMSQEMQRTLVLLHRPRRCWRVVPQRRRAATLCPWSRRSRSWSGCRATTSCGWEAPGTTPARRQPGSVRPLSSALPFNTLRNGGRIRRTGTSRWRRGKVARGRRGWRTETGGCWHTCHSTAVSIPIDVPMYLWINLFIYLYFYLKIFLPTYVPTYLSMSLSIYTILPTYLCMYLPTCLHIHKHIYIHKYVPTLLCTSRVLLYEL